MKAGRTALYSAGLMIMMIAVALAFAFAPAEYTPWAIVGFIAVSIVFASWESRRRSSEWKSFAQSIGFTPTDGKFPVRGVLPYPMLYGSAGGHDAAIWMRGGKDEPNTLVFSLVPKGLDPSFSMAIRREGVGSAIAKALGGQDLQVGNPDFDSRFRVVSNDEVRARFALGLSSQAAIMRLDGFKTLTVGKLPGADQLGSLAQLAGVPESVLTSATLRYERGDVDLDPSRAGQDLAALAVVADGLLSGARA